MARMTITVDEELLAQTQEALGTATKAETIRQALSEALRRKRLADALSHQGKIDLQLDQKTLSDLRNTE